MKRKETIKILTEFNEWRRGGGYNMLDPRIIGEAIDSAIKKLKNI